MVAIVLAIVETMLLMDNIIRVARQHALIYDGNMTTGLQRHVSVTEKDTKFNVDEPRVGSLGEFHTSVHHFARHGLCRNFEGQKHLYRALKTKFCDLKLNFIANLVLDMCNRKDYTLDKWVSELFDIDGGHPSDDSMIWCAPRGRIGYAP